MRAFIFGLLIASQLVFAGTQRILNADVIEGQKSSKNYLGNKGHFEKNANGVSGYDDGAVTRPVDGTGGTVTTTCTRSTSSPLAGDGSLIMTKGAANYQGEGCAIDFTVDSTDKAKMMQIEFEYIVSSGTFTAGTSTTDSDVIVDIYDVTNGAIIEPSSIKLLSSSTTISDKFVANFQTSSSSTSYRLMLHIASSANTSAMVLKFDDIKVFRSQYVYGTPITDWQSYTPTFTGFGTVTNIVFKSRRVGDTLETSGTGTFGTNTGTQAQMTLGYGGGNANVTIDTTKTPPTTIVGLLEDAVASTTYFGAYVLSPSANQNYVNFSLQSSTAHALTAQNGNTFSSSINFSVKLATAILGWSSSVQQSDGYDGRKIAATYRTSADVTVATSNADIVWNTAIDDSVSMMNTSTGIVTVPSAGKYVFNITGRLDTGGSAPGEVQFALIVTGKSAGTYILYDFNNFAASKIYPLTGSIDLEMNAGDTAKINAVSTTNTSTLKGGSSLYTNFNIKKIQSPTTISATERISARYYASATSVSGSLATVVWSTKDFDDFGAMSSGLFTCPVSGIYQVNTALALSGTFILNNATTLNIDVDASTKASKVHYIAAAITNESIDMSDAVSCNAGSQIRVQISNGGTTPAIVSSNTKNYISIERIK